MNFEFTENGWDDFQYWIETDIEIVAKIKELLKEIKKTPFQGLGKPEPLKYDLKGFWSRRITGEHRLVYKVEVFAATDNDKKVIGSMNDMIYQLKVAVELRVAGLKNTTDTDAA
ncbi:addiction module toxin, Txe/YoeB family, partial [Ostertagia ostertagi]